MRPNHFAVLTILLAAAAAPAQTAPAESFPKAPAPILLPPPPRTLPSVGGAQSASFAQSAFTSDSATAEHLAPFDPQRTEAKWNGTSWQLVVDGVVLKDFGGHESDARLALHLVRDLQLNQHGTVGDPAPVMEYWLHDRKAPQGQTAGLQVYSINRDTLRVDRVQGNWCLRDAQRVLFDFGASEADARQALGVIRKHGFTQVGALGQSGPVMLIFFAHGATVPVAAPVVVPAQHQPPAPLPTLHDWQAQAAGGDRGPHAGPPHAGAPIGQPTPVITTVAAAEAAGVAARTPFDWRVAQVWKDEKVWRLVAGDREIATFNSERESNLALSTVQYFRFTEREQVGSPKVHFSYFLTDGQIPRGAMIGLHCEVFQPDRLRVVQVGSQWTISTGERVLLSFEDKADEARHVLDVIQKNKCDRLCRVGLSDDYSMTFLARTR